MGDFYSWYGEQIGFDPMARQFGFRDYDQMTDWQARQLGFDSYRDLEQSIEDEEWD